MTPQEIGERALASVLHHSRDMNADARLESANEAIGAISAKLPELEKVVNDELTAEATRTSAANDVSAPIDGDTVPE